MNEALKNVLQYLIGHNIIGGKHIPEKMIMTRMIMRLKLPERREFFKDYKSLINQGYIFKQKKRTGKGYEEHISLNPKYVDDMKSWLGEDREDDYGWNFL